MNKSNLVFIMTDHQRADSLFMIQDGKEVTPNLNSLCRQSASFERTYNACPLCVPARTALATGKNPVFNGVVFNDVKGITAKNHKTIHEYLQEAGYDVAHVGVHHIRVQPDLKERMNFDLWIDEDDYKAYAEEKQIQIKRGTADAKEVLELQGDTLCKHKYSNTRVSLWEADQEDFKDCFFTRKAVEYIEKEHEKPFALFLYLWAPHPPLILPKEALNKFKKENLVLPTNVGITGEKEPHLRRKGVAAQLGEGLSLEQWREVWSAHLGLVNLADELIGKVFKALKDNQIDENTTILFTSDHGDHLGQHGMYQKMEMYEQAIRVPFILKTPNGNTTRIQEPVSHLDIVPTLLDLLDIKHAEDFEGISLKETLLTNKAVGPRDVFSQYSGNPTIGDIRRAIISGKYKYIYDGSTQGELYDLEKDPLEMDNLWDCEDHKHIAKKLHEKSKNYGEKNGDWISY